MKRWRIVTGLQTIKNNQVYILELKMYKFKNSLDKFNSSFNITDDRINEFEHNTMANIKAEAQRGKNKNNRSDYKICVFTA